MYFRTLDMDRTTAYVIPTKSKRRAKFSFPDFNTLEEIIEFENRKLNRNGELWWKITHDPLPVVTYLGYRYRKYWGNAKGWNAMTHEAFIFYKNVKAYNREMNK